MGQIAVIGCGHWGKNLVRNFSSLGALAAINDLDATLSVSMSETHGVPVKSIDDILADPNIDAVVIATPATTHGQIARQALIAGKHVFVEKPISLDLDEADELCQLSADTGKILMVGHLLQYHPAFLKLKEMCDEGRLGNLRYIYSNRLNFGIFRTVENSLWSFAPHDVSMILALFDDDPLQVGSIGHSYLQNDCADVTTTHMIFNNDRAAHIFVSWLHPFKEQRLVVVGEDGMAVFDDTQDIGNKLCFYPHNVIWNDGIPTPDKAQAEPVSIAEEEPLLSECKHFLECITDGEKPRTDGTEGKRVLRVLDTAERSMVQGGKMISFENGKNSENSLIHETACIDQPSIIGRGTRIWHFSHVLKDSHIGEDCMIGQNVLIGPSVKIGKNCKIQNNVSVYKGVEFEDNVFCGPSVVFTNVVNPRSEVNRKNEFKGTLVRNGASIGANATIVCGNSIGRYAFIGAGAVVTHDVPDYALVLGNPARVSGFVCQCGERLAEEAWQETSCKACCRKYIMKNEAVEAIPTADSGNDI